MFEYFLILNFRLQIYIIKLNLHLMLFKLGKSRDHFVGMIADFPIFVGVAIAKHEEFLYWRSQLKNVEKH